jgi:hypothetical protein
MRRRKCWWWCYGRKLEGTILKNKTKQKKNFGVSGKPAKHNGKKTFCQKDNTRLKEEKKESKT